MSTREQFSDQKHGWLSLSYARLRKVLAGILLSSIALILLVVVLPPSRDAVSGVVTVYLWSSNVGVLSPIEFKAVVAGQAVIERRASLFDSSPTAITIGFDSCAVFDRKNWQCLRSERNYQMSEGHLSILEPNGDAVLNGIEQVDRLTWWIRRLTNPARARNLLNGQSVPGELLIHN